MAKCCKVFTVFFGDRRSMFGSPTNPHQVLELIKTQVHQEKFLDPGVDMDIILVNNNNDIFEGNQYLAEIDGQASHSGHFRVLTRPNIGGSFGGFSHAFSTFSEEYDYWIFSEDDLVMFLPHIPRVSIEQMEADPEIAFLAYGPMANFCGRRHVGGGYGMGKREHLLQVAKECQGVLPYPQASDYTSIERGGEVTFTSIYYDLGLRIESINNYNTWCINYQFHPHSTLALQSGLDLNTLPKEKFFYQVGGVYPELLAPSEVQQ